MAFLYQPPTLKDCAIRKIALSILKNFTDYHLNEDSPLMLAINALPLPSKVKPDIEIAAQETLHRSYQWLHVFGNYGTVEDPSQELFVHVHFDAYGLVDQRITALEMVRDHKLARRTRFHVACFACLEDHVRELHRRTDSADHAQEECRFLVSYWLSRVKGNEKAFWEDYSEDSWGARLVYLDDYLYGSEPETAQSVFIIGALESYYNGSIAAFEYFVNLLPETEEQELKLLEWMVLDADNSDHRTEEFFVLYVKRASERGLAIQRLRVKDNYGERQALDYPLQLLNWEVPASLKTNWFKALMELLFDDLDAVSFKLIYNQLCCENLKRWLWNQAPPSLSKTCQLQTLTFLS